VDEKDYICNYPMVLLVKSRRDVERKTARVTKVSFSVKRKSTCCPQMAAGRNRSLYRPAGTAPKLTEAEVTALFCGSYGVKRLTGPTGCFSLWSLPKQGMMLTFGNRAGKSAQGRNSFLEKA